jgi:hypothetical protein
MRLTHITIVGLIAVALAGCGGGSSGGGTVTVTAIDSSGSTTTTVATPTERPEDVIKTMVDQALKGQYSRVYSRLHPGQKSMVSFDLYSKCVSHSNPGGTTMVAFKTNEVFDDPANVPGVPEKTSKAVTFTITATDGSSGTLTRHLILHDGEWFWTFNKTQMDALAQGQCPP